MCVSVQSVVLVLLLLFVVLLCEIKYTDIYSSLDMIVNTIFELKSLEPEAGVKCDSL